MQRAIDRRSRLLAQFTNGPEEDQRWLLAYLATDIRAFFNDWVWTYDPRQTGPGKSPIMPFDLWPRQAEYLTWIEEMETGRREALVEKSRDVGATSLDAGFAIHRWLFRPGYKTTFGSRVEDLVDKLGDPDTIFEKIRNMLDLLPRWMMPRGFDPGRHSNYMRLLNPANGNIIAGEGGRNMGRGGRSSIYFVDEAAHIEHAASIEMAIVANSDVRLWVSSVNGMGNLFARKRHSGRYPVFVFKWEDDPRKDKAWEKSKKAEIESHVWAQEYARDYGASVEGICIPGAWVQSARALYDHGLVDPHPEGTGAGGLDVGAGGKGKSVLIVRRGAVVMPPHDWSTPDTITMTYDALDDARKDGAAFVNYDNIGVGTGPRSALMHSTTAERLPAHGVNVGVAPTKKVWDDKLRSDQKFANLKAELWWTMRDRFQKAHQRWLWESGETGGMDHALDDCIALPPHATLEAEISYPKWFRRPDGKIIIESKEQLAKRGLPSPDFAEALVLTGAEPQSGEAVFEIN